MKTQDEIIELSYAEYPMPEYFYQCGYEDLKRTGYIKGYTDCQNEMSKSKWISVDDALPPLPPKECGGHFYWGYFPFQSEGKTVDMIRKVVYTFFGRWEYMGQDITDALTHYQEYNQPEPPQKNK